MSTYLLVKYLHMSCALISIAGFSFRGALKLMNDPLIRTRWLRVAPHIVDSVLLASAVWLAWQSHQYPFVQPWLSAKLLALLLYIGLGFVVMRIAKRQRTRVLAYTLALATAAYIIAVALSRDPAIGILQL